jgi:lysophospholipase L1-like esterase
MSALSDAHQLILGLLLHSDDMFPGFGKRALAWSRDLDGLLHQPERGRVYLELCAPLMEGGAALYLLRDGTHLSEHGHRRVAELVTPALQSLLMARGAAADRPD